jgi:NAD+ kinase
MPREGRVTPAPPPFRRVGLLAKPGGANVAETLRTVIGFLAARHHETRLCESCATVLGGRASGAPLSELVGEIDLLIVIGGDGTLLNGARAAADAQIPVIGINLGRLGFLTDISPDRATESLARILDGEYVQDPRCLLQAQVGEGAQPRATQTAFNDVVLHKWNTARLIEFETYIDGRFVNTQRSDGLIISTPTGSTAYALSGGGPLLHPALDALVLVPICPHTLSNRPLVVAGDSVVEVVVSGHTDPEHLRISCDGQETLELRRGERVRVAKHACGIRLIHPAGHDHYRLLRAKLGWSEPPR